MSKHAREAVLALPLDARKGAAMTDAQLRSRRRRTCNANKLLITIAGRGRRFFCGPDGRVARSELEGWRLWHIDRYNGARIYMHQPDGAPWCGFSGGGTVKALTSALAEHIKTGDQMPSHYLGPWPDWMQVGDPWGYGEDMALVRREARALDIIADDYEQP